MIKKKKKICTERVAVPEHVWVVDDFEADNEEQFGEMHMNLGVYIVNDEIESIDDSNDNNYWSLLTPNEDEFETGDEPPPLVSRGYNSDDSSDDDSSCGPLPGKSRVAHGSVKWGGKVDNDKCQRQAVEDGVTLINKGKVKSKLDPWCLYLDTCSTFHQVVNKDCVSEIYDVKHALRSYSNGGPSTTARRSRLPYLNHLETWFNEEGLANIISFDQLERLYPITYDHIGKIFVVHTKGIDSSEGKIEFHRSKEGFPYVDLRERDDAVMMVNTVRGNIEGFTRSDVLAAERAYKAANRMGAPSDKDFRMMVRTLPNCPITARDVSNAIRIYGPNLAGIRGKTVRRTPERVNTDKIEIPRDFQLLHCNVTLEADVFYVNEIPFLLSMSQKIKFLTLECIPNRSSNTLTVALNRVVSLYRRAGYSVKIILLDMEFECLEEHLDVPINVAAAREHVPGVEREIRTIKERGRALLSTSPFKKFPRRIIIELVYYIVLWLNASPAKSSISNEYSPREIISGQKPDYKRDCKVDFFSYCEVHDEPSPTNSMKPRTRPCIALGPTANLQGSYKFLDLETGKKLKKRSWTELPMPDSVISQVEAMAEKEKRDGRWSVTNRHKQEVSYYDEDDDQVDVAPIVHPDLAAEIPGVARALQEDEVVPMVVDDRRAAAAAAALRHRSLSNYPSHILGSAYPISDDEHSAREHADDDDDSAYLTPPDSEEDEDLDSEDAESEDESSEDEESEDDESEDGESEDEDSIHDNSDDESKDEEREISDDESDVESEDEAASGDADAVSGDAGHALSEDSDIAEVQDELEAETTGVEEEKADTSGLRRSSRRPAPIQYLAKDPKYMSQESMSRARTSEQLKAQAQRVKENAALLSFNDVEGTVLMQMSKIDGAINEPDKCNSFSQVVHMCLLQLSLKQGLKTFGERGTDAAMKEVRQLHDFKTFRPVHAEALTHQQRVDALSSLIFLKEKSNGDIKGRACADGRKQRATMTKEESTSPTVKIESVFLTSVIEANENRDVAAVDIRGAFLHTPQDPNDDTVHMVLKGELCELMVKAAPELYTEYVIVGKNGTRMLYVEMQKALYGMLKSALLFYLKLLDDLTKAGFKLNPYDPCVANKTVAGKQLTVAWHVDDLKISHENPAVVDRFIKYIDGIYPGVTVQRGKELEYLGMTLDYSVEGEVTFSQVPYICEMLEEFPEELGSAAATPASENLFKVDEASSAPKLSVERSAIFHQFVAQLLFVSSRSRRDIQTAVAFLTTRVKSPDEHDWVKLRRVMKYLKGTRFLKLTLSAENLRVLKWYVDSSYAVHPDCKGHSGGMLTLGKGAVTSGSRKQKLNGRSSTEAEIIGVDDFMGSLLWTLYFMREQGYDATSNILMQDNQSTMKLLINGQKSSSKRTKHINVRFFFAKDVIDRGDMTVEYCPTKEMWADVLTKPLQGELFRIMRSNLQGCDVNYSDVPNETDAKAVQKVAQKFAGVAAKKLSDNLTTTEEKRVQFKGVGLHERKPIKSILRKESFPKARRSVLGDKVSKRRSYSDVVKGNRTKEKRDWSGTQRMNDADQ